IECLEHTADGWCNHGRGCHAHSDIADHAGLSYDDAAEALGVKVGTIKSRVNRARTRLAELIGGTDHESGASRRASS
ncbi:MAG TPA: sigma factor-like helix-turn-helix DNA-binding protein, partial [Gemmatimonadales bacterium]|nr:sigma factor-like helix-turn-helix DNA-binding protein [Gemmatimonadales bacterium]